MRFLSRTPGTRCRTIRLGRSFVSGGSGSREGSRRSIYGLTTETDTSTSRNAALTTTQVGAEGLCDYKKPRAAVKTASSSILFGTASGMRDFPEGFERLRRVHLSIGKEFGVPIVDASYANLKYLGDKATTERIESISHADKGHPGRVCRRSDVLSRWRNNAMKRFQGRIPLVNTFGKASLHPVDGTPSWAVGFLYQLMRHLQRGNRTQPDGSCRACGHAKRCRQGSANGRVVTPSRDERCVEKVTSEPLSKP